MEEYIEMNTTETGRPDVIFAVMKLTRSMRRRPPKPGEGFAPWLGRPLQVLADNPGVTSRELAELLDIRPSSLTELLSKLESDGLVTRTPDENDKRVSRVSLTDKGQEQAAKMKAEHEQRKARASACFTDDEAAQFCDMCRRLGEHLENIAREEGADEDNFMPPPPPDFRRGPCAGMPGENFGGRHHRFPPPRPRKL